MPVCIEARGQPLTVPLRSCPPCFLGHSLTGTASCWSLLSRWSLLTRKFQGSAHPYLASDKHVLRPLTFKWVPGPNSVLHTFVWSRHFACWALSRLSLLVLCDWLGLSWVGVHCSVLLHPPILCLLFTWVLLLSDQHRPVFCRFGAGAGCFAFSGKLFS